MEKETVRKKRFNREGKGGGAGLTRLQHHGKECPLSMGQWNGTSRTQRHGNTCIHARIGIEEGYDIMFHHQGYSFHQEGKQIIIPF